jgi:hypothetical protein
MPVIDGIMDVPVPEWCPAYDAALWIMLKRPPVAFPHEGLMGDDGYRPLSFEVRRDPNYFPSWSKLYEAASQEKVGLRGRPAIGLQKIEFNPGVPPSASDIGAPPSVWLRYEKLGEFEDITPAKLKAVDRFVFSSVEEFLFLSDVMVIPTESLPKPTWAYTDIGVNVRQLVRWFHPAEGKAFRVGAEVNFIEPEAPRAEVSAEAPQAKSSPEAAVTRHAGGRPRKWEWDAATNAIWAAIYDGTLVPKQRDELTCYMTDWFSVRHEEGPPEESQIRKAVSGIWSVVKPDNGEKP